jgi:2-hydroxycyclohexanecarboxyl-CoA dehydrogenase
LWSAGRAGWDGRSRPRLPKKAVGLVWDVSADVSATATELGGTGWQVDVSDAPAVRAATAETWAQFGGVDHLVFAVGIGSGKFGFPFWKVEPEEWDRVLRVNLIGAANLAHGFAPKLAERRRGTMLFLASVAGQISSQTDPPYSGSITCGSAGARCSGSRSRAWWS